MEQEDLRKLLFSSAFHAMACDGEIHEDELIKIKELGKRTPYFKGISIDKAINEMAAELDKGARKSFRAYFDSIRDNDLDQVQQLLVIEVVLQMIYADTIIDENEIQFLRIIVKILRAQPEVIKERFGAIDFLFDNELPDIASHKELIQTFEVPDFKDLEAEETEVEPLEIPKLEDLKQPPNSSAVEDSEKD